LTTSIEGFKNQQTEGIFAKRYEKEKLKAAQPLTANNGWRFIFL
jgi:hypothetical protein